MAEYCVRGFCQKKGEGDMRKHAIWAAACCGILGCSLVACVPNIEQTVSNQDVSIKAGDYSPGEGLQGVYDSMANRAKDYAPEIRTLDDGTQIQRTPDSSEDSVFPGSESSYNTYSLNADNRGCDSCHEDGLADLVRNMDYKHFDLETGLGTNIDVKDCKMCHSESSWMQHGLTNQFGSLIHGIHSKDSFKGDCMSCHTATSDGEGLRLWEDAKYDVLSGILPVQNVEGDFSYEQDKLGGSLGLTWWPIGVDDERVDAAFRDDAEVDPAQFESWEISVTGMVDNPFSITLGELVEQAPSETFISSSQCIINPSSGELLASVEVTGVPVSWLLEKAEVQEGALSLNSIGSDGYTGYGNYLDDVMGEEGGWIIYEVNGRRLTNLEGYPCRIWYPDHSFPMSTKAVTELVVEDAQPHFNEGFGIEGVFGGAGSWIGDEGSAAEFRNKPNVAICNTPEGEIIPIGKPYVFEGYADAFNEQIAAVEFSMDGGQTWTSFDTSDSDKKKWVYWNFSWTPEEEGAYVLSVRAVTDEGRVSYQADEVMVNVK